MSGVLGKVKGTLNGDLRSSLEELNQNLRVTVGTYEIDLLFIVLYVFFSAILLLGLLAPSLISAFAVIFMLVALAQAWNIIEGLSGYPDFGLVGYFGIGAYVVAIGGERFDLPFFAAIVLAFVLVSSIAFLLTPIMKGNQPYFFAFTTLIIFELVYQAFNVIGLVQGYIPGTQGWPVESHFSNIQMYFIMLTFMVGVSLLVSVLKQSRVGYGLMTLKQDHDVARSLGINIGRLRIIAMGIYCGTVAVIGGFYAVSIGWVSPAVVFRLDYTLIPIAMVLAGGAGRVRMVLVASLLVLFVREGINQLYPTWALAIFGVFIIVLSLIVAQGGVSKWLQNTRQRIDQIRERVLTS